MAANKKKYTVNTVSNKKAVAKNLVFKEEDTSSIIKKVKEQLELQLEQLELQLGSLKVVCVGSFVFSLMALVFSIL